MTILKNSSRSRRDPDNAHGPAAASLLQDLYESDLRAALATSGGALAIAISIRSESALLWIITLTTSGYLLLWANRLYRHNEPRILEVVAITHGAGPVVRIKETQPRTSPPPPKVLPSRPPPDLERIGAAVQTWPPPAGRPTFELPPHEQPAVQTVDPASVPPTQ